MIKAIETSYKGYRFRSRLEARWAVFFDALGIKWEYEPEGFELEGGLRYLPDFLLMDCIWFEVKGQVPSDEEMAKLELLSVGTKKWAFIAFGDMGFPEPDAEKFTGTNILGVCPMPEINRLVVADFGDEKVLHVHARCGFYETSEGGFGLEDLYDNDLPLKHPPSVRTADVQYFGGHLVPRANCGTGRLYRSKKIKKAYEAARSARFEFGESGARVCGSQT